MLNAYLQAVFANRPTFANKGESLNELRQKIAQVDADILFLVAKRLEIAREIGLIKKEKQLPLIDELTEAKVYQRNSRLAYKLGLGSELAEKLTRLLIECARKIQQK